MINDVSYLGMSSGESSCGVSEFMRTPFMSAAKALPATLLAPSGDPPLSDEPPPPQRKSAMMIALRNAGTNFFFIFPPEWLGFSPVTGRRLGFPSLFSMPFHPLFY
jgi:hypothetical protein